MIEYGRTGFEVSELCLGTSNWGPLRVGETESDRDARIGALGRDFFSGTWPVTFIDTSNIYGDSQAEGLIGRSLAEAGGLPGGFVLQTKLDRDVATGGFSADQMWRSLEQSLERLGLDRVQVLFLHDPNDFGFGASMAPGGPVEALVAMKDQRLTASIGISDGPVDTLAKFVETDVFDALITHNRYTLVDRSASALLDFATAHRMGVTNAAPFGGGILTGDPRFAGRYGYLPAPPSVETAVAAMAAACHAAGVPLAAAALQFSMRDPRIHSTVVGASSVERFEEVLAFSRTPIAGALWDELDSLAPTFALDSLL